MSWFGIVTALLMFSTGFVHAQDVAPANSEVHVRAGDGQEFYNVTLKLDDGRLFLEPVTRDDRWILRNTPAGIRRMARAAVGLPADYSRRIPFDIEDKLEAVFKAQDGKIWAITENKQLINVGLALNAQVGVGDYLVSTPTTLGLLASSVAMITGFSVGDAAQVATGVAGCALTWAASQQAFSVFRKLSVCPIARKLEGFAVEQLVKDENQNLIDVVTKDKFGGLSALSSMTRQDCEAALAANHSIAGTVAAVTH